MQKQKYAGWMKKYAKITQATVPTKNEKICQNFTFIRTIQITAYSLSQKYITNAYQSSCMHTLLFNEERFVREKHLYTIGSIQGYFILISLKFHYP